MHRGIPVGNKILQRKWEEKNQALHRKKLYEIKSRTDSSCPRTAMYGHVKRKAKKEQLLEERYTEIERENRILLEKMSSIMQRNQRLLSEQRIRKRSLNKESRKRQLIQITMENQALLKRLQERKPNYAREYFEKDWQQKEQRLKNICEFPYLQGDVRRKPQKEEMNNSLRATTGSLVKGKRPRKLEPLKSEKKAVYKKGMNIGDRYFLIEIYNDPKFIKILAYDVESPDKFSLYLPIDEASDLMSGQQNYAKLAEMLSMENGELILIDPRALEIEHKRAQSDLRMQDNKAGEISEQENDDTESISSSRKDVKKQDSKKDQSQAQSRVSYNSSRRSHMDQKSLTERSGRRSIKSDSSSNSSKHKFQEANSQEEISIDQNQFDSSNEQQESDKESSVESGKQSSRKSSSRKQSSRKQSSRKSSSSSSSKNSDQEDSRILKKEDSDIIDKQEEIKFSRQESSVSDKKSLRSGASSKIGNIQQVQYEEQNKSHELTSQQKKSSSSSSSSSSQQLQKREPAHDSKQIHEQQSIDRDSEEEKKSESDYDQKSLQMGQDQTDIHIPSSIIQKENSSLDHKSSRSSRKQSSESEKVQNEEQSHHSKKSSDHSNSSQSSIKSSKKSQKFANDSDQNISHSHHVDQLSQSHHTEQGSHKSKLSIQVHELEDEEVQIEQGHEFLPQHIHADHVESEEVKQDIPIQKASSSHNSHQSSHKDAQSEQEEQKEASDSNSDSSKKSHQASSKSKKSKSDSDNELSQDIAQNHDSQANAESDKDSKSSKSSHKKHSSSSSSESDKNDESHQDEIIVNQKHSHASEEHEQQFKSLHDSSSQLQHEESLAADHEQDSHQSESQQNINLHYTQRKRGLLLGVLFSPTIIISLPILLAGTSLATVVLQLAILFISSSIALICRLSCTQVGPQPDFILKNIGPSSTSQRGSTAVTYYIYSRVVIVSSWYTIYSGAYPREYKAEDGCNMQGIPVLKLQYSPMLFIFAALWKYPEATTFLTISQLFPEVVKEIRRDIKISLIYSLTSLTFLNAFI